MKVGLQTFWTWKRYLKCKDQKLIENQIVQWGWGVSGNACPCARPGFRAVLVLSTQDEHFPLPMLSTCTPETAGLRCWLLYVMTCGVFTVHAKNSALTEIQCYDSKKQRLYLFFKLSFFRMYHISLFWIVPFRKLDFTNCCLSWWLEFHETSLTFIKSSLSEFWD